MQRFAFQQLYNERFKDETLESMDDMLGTVSDKEIAVFQKAVKDIGKWKDLKGFQGYKTFMNYFGIKITKAKLKPMMYAALDRSTELKYHDWILGKFWRRYT
jgi:hypothetical protein